LVKPEVASLEEENGNLSDEVASLEEEIALEEHKG